MPRPRRTNPELRLVAVFLLLVLVPSGLLGWFCLRAVESERQARLGRLLDDSRRYAEFAARTVHQELTELEETWQELVPESPNSPHTKGTMKNVTAGLDSAALVDGSVHAAYVFDMSGRIVKSMLGAGTEIRMEPAFPDPSEAELFATAVAKGEDAESEPSQAAAAEAIYADLESKLHNPRLRAMAATFLARAALQAQDWDRARDAAGRVQVQKDRFDFDNQPLALVAGVQKERAQEASGDIPAAAATFVELARELQARGSELAPSQYTYFRERILEAGIRLSKLARGGLGRELETRCEALGTARKPTVGDAFYARKLERKLLRAAMEQQLWSPRWRYVSDVVEDRPYLLAYVYLPDATGTRVTGLFGLVVDLPRLSVEALPSYLRELQLSEDAWLEVVDQNGRHVIGEEPSGVSAKGMPPAARSNLGEPFEFWTVEAHARIPVAALRGVGFQTRVYLYLILILLLAIAAGAVLVTLGLRRESRLARLKTTFVSNVSHELRTPLTSIRMYAEMLEGAGDRLPEPERRRQLGIIRGESTRLERLIDAVLDFASLQRGTKVFTFEYEEVGELLRAVAEDFRSQAESRGFQYRVEVDLELPEVRLDADAIRQVILNLLSNALKYSDKERWIAVRAFRRGDVVGLQVEDHGIGIEPGDQQRIFDDFYRVDQHLSSARQGVGLGLTLVRRIVEAHGGQVVVESTPGRGSRFTVWLPVEPTEDLAVPPPAGHVPLEA